MGHPMEHEVASVLSRTSFIVIDANQELKLNRRCLDYASLRSTWRGKHDWKADVSTKGACARMETSPPKLL